MTCIVAIANGKNVWMGGDTCGSDYTSRTQVAHPKVFTKSVMVEGKEPEAMLVGGCGSFRMLQLLEYSLVAPMIQDGQSFVAYLATSFVDTCRTHFKEKGLAHCINGVEKLDDIGSSFMVGFRGQLYHIHADYQAFATTNQEDAAGSGTLLALGSLHTTRKLKWTPQQRIQAALTAAATINPFVSEPFNIVQI
jgi:hypothetical protein